MTLIEADGDTCFAEKVYFDEDCFEPCPPTGGGGGGAPPYRQEGAESVPCPEVKIKRVYFEDLNGDEIIIQVSGDVKIG